MTNFAEKIRPRIVFDLTIHRVDLIIDVSFGHFFAEKPLVVFSLNWLFFHSARCFFTINQFDWLKIFELDCQIKFSNMKTPIKEVEGFYSITFGILIN
jgi:hypothetical protein